VGGLGEVVGERLWELLGRVEPSLFEYGYYGWVKFSGRF
jgi:hypothetical protein